MCYLKLLIISCMRQRYDKYGTAVMYLY
jgi:hypothetical protein